MSEEPFNPRERARLIVLESIIFQYPDSEPLGQDLKLSRFLSSGEDWPYTRRMKVGRDWVELDLKAIAVPGMLRIENLARVGNYSPSLLTPQQQAEKDKKTIRVSFSPQDVSTILIIPPGDSLRLSFAEVLPRICLRCEEEPTLASITIYPK